MDTLLTPTDLAERWGGGKTARWVIEQRFKNGWPCVKVGRTIRFTQQQVDEIIRRQTVATAASVEAAGQTLASSSRN